MEGSGCSLGGQRRELLRLQLLLDAVILAAAGGHCGERPSVSGGEAGVCFHLCGLDSTVLTALTELSPPLPSHPALAVGTRLVEVAGRARGLVHHG